MLGSDSVLVLACRHLPALRNTLGMSRQKNENRFLSRRSLLKTMGLAPLVLRTAPLHGSSFFVWISRGFRSEHSQAFPLSDVRLTPHYPARSPLEDVLRLVAPGSDEFVTEKYAFEIEVLLQAMEPDTEGIGHRFFGLSRVAEPFDRRSHPGSRIGNYAAFWDLASIAKEDALAARWLPGGNDLSSRSGSGWDRSPGWRPRNLKLPVSKKLPAPLCGSAGYSLRPGFAPDQRAA